MVFSFFSFIYSIVFVARLLNETSVFSSQLCCSKTRTEVIGLQQDAWLLNHCNLACVTKSKLMARASTLTWPHRKPIVPIKAKAIFDFIYFSIKQQFFLNHTAVEIEFFGGPNWRRTSALPRFGTRDSWFLCIKRVAKREIIFESKFLSEKK